MKNNNLQTHIYWLLNDIHDFPICDAPGCNNPISIDVKNIYNGYDRTACSYKCARKTDHYLKKFGDSVEKHFGCRHPMHCQAIKDKVRNTTEERWGGIGFASDEIHKKYEDTCIERFGVSNGGGSEQALKKIIDTKMDRYGHPYFVFPMGEHGMYSKGEKEVLEFVRSIYSGVVIENDRTQM